MHCFNDFIIGDACRSKNCHSSLLIKLDVSTTCLRSVPSMIGRYKLECKLHPPPHHRYWQMSRAVISTTTHMGSSSSGISITRVCPMLPNLPTTHINKSNISGCSIGKPPGKVIFEIYLRFSPKTHHFWKTILSFSNVLHFSRNKILG